MLGRFSPAAEGVDEAAQRITSLLLIISYSGFLLLLTPREEIIAGLKYLLSPLKLFGIDSSSFALRLGLVLAIVPQIKDQNIAGNHTITHKSISKVIDQAAEMIKQAADENQRYEVESILIAETPRPGFIEILVPVLLFVWLFCSFS